MIVITLVLDLVMMLAFIVVTPFILVGALIVVIARDIWRLTFGNKC